MGFVIYKPTNLSGRALRPGECSMQGDGKLAIHVDDLQKLKVADRIVLLLDAATFRVGIRAPRDDEPTVRVAKHESKSGCKYRSICIKGAIKQAMKLDVFAVRGRYQLTHNSDLAWFQLPMPKTR